jgi:hypothetical protein
MKRRVQAGSGRKSLRWCMIRPPVSIPLLATTTSGRGCERIAFESATSLVYCSPGYMSGESPEGGRRLLVEDLRVTEVDLTGAAGHRRVEVERQARDAALAHQLVEDPDQLLGATDGEGGHQQDAAVAADFIDGRGQLFDGLLVRRVLAVAVGRLDEDEVGVADGGRVTQDRRVAAAEVT